MESDLYPVDAAAVEPVHSKRCAGHVDLVASVGDSAEQLQNEPGHRLVAGTSGRQLETDGGFDLIRP